MAGSERVQEPEAGGEEQRRHVRKRVLWMARLEANGTSSECVILNVSRSGAKLRLTTPLTVAARQVVKLDMPSHGTLPAEVIWQRGDKMGIRFSADPEQVAKILGTALTL